MGVEELYYVCLAASVSIRYRMDFDEYLRSFLSGDNTVRRNAEAYLTELKAHADSLSLELLRVSVRVIVAAHCLLAGS